MADSTSSDIDSDVVSQVRNFIDGDNTKLDIIQRIVEYEDNHAGEDCSFYDYDEHTDVCWSPGDDVSMLPAYMGIIKNSAFTNVVFSSNSGTILSLKDRDSTREAIKRERDEPEQGSEEWIARQVERESVGIGSVLDDVEVTEEDMDFIMDRISNHDCLEYWSHYIAPNLKHRDNAKKAVLIMLASPEDKYGSKGRINVKIYGPPGTGKTSLKKFLSTYFAANTIDGPRVSKVDLTYNKNSGKLGTLPKSHKGIIVVEEADEMENAAVGSTLTSLGESGSVEISDMVIPAEARGVMLSNFMSKQEIIRAWSPESLNRFDFVIKFEMLSDSKRDDTLDDLYASFREPSSDEKPELLKKYLKVVRDFTPSVTELDEIKEYKRQHITRIENIREGISILNVAWTIARLNLEDLTLDHYKTAFDLVCSESNTLREKFS